MKIDSTIFGAITIDGKTYQHDVVVRLSGEVVKRKKKLSKKLYGTSHVLSKDEAKFLFEKGCDQIVIGLGQTGNVRLSSRPKPISKKRLRGPVEANTRGDPDVQPVACKEDRTVSRNLPAGCG